MTGPGERAEQLRAAGNAARLARWMGEGQTVLIERDRIGRWTSVPVGRGDADRCERAPWAGARGAR